MKEMRKMKKKLFIHLIVGFVVGAGIGNLIAFLFSTLSGGDGIVAAELVAKTGTAGAIVLQTFLSGILGLVSIGGMLLYEIDKWSLAKATIVHFVSISACFVGVSLILHWFPLRFAYYAIALGAMAVGFIIIWVCMYLAWKKEVREMNEELNEYKKNNLKDER